MSHALKKQARRLAIIVLAGSFISSAMYVSFAMGFRAGIGEDTVYILPQC